MGVNNFLRSGSRCCVSAKLQNGCENNGKVTKDDRKGPSFSILVEKDQLAEKNICRNGQKGLEKNRKKSCIFRDEWAENLFEYNTKVFFTANGEKDTRKRMDQLWFCEKNLWISAGLPFCRIGQKLDKYSRYNCRNPLNCGKLGGESGKRVEIPLLFPLFMWKTLWRKWIVYPIR